MSTGIEEVAVRNLVIAITSILFLGFCVSGSAQPTDDFVQSQAENQVLKDELLRKIKEKDELLRKLKELELGIVNLRTQLSLLEPQAPLGLTELLKMSREYLMLYHDPTITSSARDMACSAMMKRITGQSFVLTGTLGDVETTGLNQKQFRTATVVLDGNPPGTVSIKTAFGPFMDVRAGSILKPSQVTATMGYVGLKVYTDDDAVVALPKGTRVTVRMNSPCTIVIDNCNTAGAIVPDVNLSGKGAVSRAGAITRNTGKNPKG